MDNDDQQIGHILSRREVLALFGAASVALLAACGPGQVATAVPATATTPATAIASQAPVAANNAATLTPTTGAASTVATSVATSVPTTGAATTAVATTAASQATTAPVAGAAASAAAVLPACIVRPEVTEGPYYVAEELNRIDIRSNPSTGAVSAGALLTLTFNVSQIANNACTPLAGAKVEIWHCDAAGSYSDVTDRGVSTKGQQFLRGYQMTDANGKATFTTIYPGWYQGRAVHIHFKVHPDATRVFTSQLFFDDVLSDQVFAQAPYASKGKRNVLNSRDGIYKDQLLITTAKAGQGYAASFDIGIQKS